MTAGAVCLVVLGVALLFVAGWLAVDAILEFRRDGDS